jgi:hypothetical protein
VPHWGCAAPPCRGEAPPRPPRLQRGTFPGDVAVASANRAPPSSSHLRMIAGPLQGCRAVLLRPTCTAPGTGRSAPVGTMRWGDRCATGAAPWRATAYDACDRAWSSGVLISTRHRSLGPLRGDRVFDREGCATDGWGSPWLSGGRSSRARRSSVGLVGWRGRSRPVRGRRSPRDAPGRPDSDRRGCDHLGRAGRPRPRTGCR